MKAIQSVRSAKGVTIGDASSTNPSTNVLIDGNSIFGAIDQEVVRYAGTGRP